MLRVSSAMRGDRSVIPFSSQTSLLCSDFLPQSDFTFLPIADVRKPIGEDLPD